MITGTRTISLEIDGRPVTVPEGTTLYDAARQLDVEIPVLCHDPRMRPVGVCRMCVVDVGERVLAAACVRKAADGMSVITRSDKIERCRKTLTELLLSDYPEGSAREQKSADDLLLQLARDYGIEGRAPSLPRGNGRPQDDSSPVIAVDHSACILCDRCIRGCDEIQHNDVIGRTGKGYGSRISFDLDNPMGESTCVACGECAAVCPTGALTVKPITVPIEADRPLETVDSVCPYCGVGCAITYHVDREKNAVARAEGRDSPASESRLCVKGRFGFDYAKHPQRLTTPLIRRDDYYPKGPLSSDVKGERRKKPGGLVDYDEVMPAFREATWEEALDLAASRLKAIRDEFGPSTLAGFGSAKCSNEEAYLFQKLVRAVFGTNNIDHCTRLCHASSVAALLETIGSGAVTNVFSDVRNADVAIVTGSNTTENHPVAATFIKDAASKGTTLIVIDSRETGIARHAHHFLQIEPGSDVALYNAMMHVMIEEDLIKHDYIARYTEGFEELKGLVARYTPEVAAKICGVSADKIAEVARIFGKANAAIIYWGMGISQHTHGTDNARCLISLALLSGNIGRPGTGLHPLRGQNNVQGASDAGLIPMVYPDYQNVASEEARQKFEEAWGVPLDPNPGLTVVEIIGGALDGSIKGMYMMGENPFLSDPNVNKVRKALASLEFLCVQDIFLTETAEFADVILPATSFFEKTGTYTNSDRRVQVGQVTLEAPGEARLDWEIVCEIATRMGYPMSYDSASAIFEEFTSLAPSYSGLDYDNLKPTGKLWPCPDPETSDGVQLLFGDGFPTSSGRGKFVPVDYQPAAELPDDEYPFVLNTGRMLEHWHTGTMTRRAKALHAIEPEAVCQMNPQDLQAMGLEPGTLVTLTTRRGTITLKVRSAPSVARGNVFMPFHFREASANILTNDVLDPHGKIPEYKFCAVKVEKA
ncbi:MAG: formate dehydrogenase subunit alpha [Gemmatimonadetes bacterium]|uniref:nitrate reductase (cytochrome) n=1 Tax=Candidatus Kutchimonas denitrificans TaxID=3056748 RepID=A0AAE4Z7A2_9BACT|nr:formate dehydrogenase subunit alpha [Gemmatimonadota bacterium]NIR74903.1 formate dehydrogenase subunit alpha [Candidatus Kutchimonas denitrificans]NIS00015.1 formate dehydrogenase subunit alpha [Gemmatimonadota bacterium]NIT65598.1 formate dehydrogenase subunit alpha [Gemmatimonadota bacterium]NIU52568.1 formate dehydrogenase subunit alpha [Gemmatimonadota bacterium]